MSNNGFPIEVEAHLAKSGEAVASRPLVDEGTGEVLDGREGSP